MLEQIVNLAQQEKIITKRIGRSFRFSPWIGNWSKQDQEENRGNVWIGIDLKLSKTFQRISCISTAIDFNDKVEDEYKVRIEAYDKKYNAIYSEEYKGRGLDFDKYASQVIQLWKEWLQ